MNHGCLQLRRNRDVNGLIGHHGDQARTSPLRAARGEHGGAVKTTAAGQDREMSETAFVAVHGTPRRKLPEIFRDDNGKVAGERAGDQPDVGRDFEVSDKRRRFGHEKTAFHGADRERVGGAEGGAQG